MGRLNPTKVVNELKSLRSSLKSIAFAIALQNFVLPGLQGPAIGEIYPYAQVATAKDLRRASFVQMHPFSSETGSVVSCDSTTTV